MATVGIRFFLRRCVLGMSLESVSLYKSFTYTPRKTEREVVNKNIMYVRYLAFTGSDKMIKNNNNSGKRE